MMLRRLLGAALLGAAAIAALPGDALAWNRAGHMVSGSIAYRRLQQEDAAALARADVDAVPPAVAARVLDRVEVHRVQRLVQVAGDVEHPREGDGARRVGRLRVA